MKDVKEQAVLDYEWALAEAVKLLNGPRMHDMYDSTKARVTLARDLLAHVDRLVKRDAGNGKVLP